MSVIVLSPDPADGGVHYSLVIMQYLGRMARRSWRRVLLGMKSKAMSQGPCGRLGC